MKRTLAPFGAARAVLTLTAALLCPDGASATYSIVAADTATGELGGTGTSCLSGSDVYIIFAAVPSAGVVHAQARYSRTERDRGAALLAQGLLPAEVVQALAGAAGASERQFAIVDVLGNVGAFTGEAAGAHASHVTGREGSRAYVAAGNLLTSARVLSQAAAGFEAPACDLPERLMNALEAGAQNGEGDRRCTPMGIPSDSAFLQVHNPHKPAGSHLSLRVPTSGARSPLPELRAQFLTWRASNPCPVPAPQPESTKESGGCSCRTHAGSNGRLGLLIVIAVALGALYRRRPGKRCARDVPLRGVRSSAAIPLGSGREPPAEPN